jgi:hypothetical protein
VQESSPETRAQLLRIDHNTSAALTSVKKKMEH